jgi:hypothetical protein
MAIERLGRRNSIANDQFSMTNFQSNKRHSTVFTFFSTKAEDGFKIGTSHIESRNVASANLELLPICQMDPSCFFDISPIHLCQYLADRDPIKAFA